MKRALSIFAIAALSACATIPDETTEGVYVVMTRPPNVPPSYLATPNGWFDPSCVHQLDDGERVLEDGRVARADGSVRAIAPCTSPRYDVEGRPFDERAHDRAKPPATNGWIEYAASVATGPVSYFHAQWTVPPAPAQTDATIYFFPGLENRSSLDTPILQPVLGWNQADGPAGWSLMSWDCCSQGQFHSAPIAISPGTLVLGDLIGTSCDASGLCATWQIVSRNKSNGQSTTLTVSPGLVMDYVAAGVLETYGVASCQQLPPSGTTFYNFVIGAAPSGTSINPPAWGKHVFAATPSCGYAVTGSNSAITIGVVGTVCAPNDDQACCPYAGGCSCYGDRICKANGQWGACVGASPKGTPCN